MRRHPGYTDTSCPTSRRRGGLSESQEKGIRRMHAEDFPNTEIARAQLCSATAVREFVARDPTCLAHKRPPSTPDSVGGQRQAASSARVRAMRRARQGWQFPEPMTATEAEEEAGA